MAVAANTGGAVERHRRLGGAIYNAGTLNDQRIDDHRNKASAAVRRWFTRHVCGGGGGGGGFGSGVGGTGGTGHTGLQALPKTGTRSSVWWEMAVVVVLMVVLALLPP